MCWATVEAVQHHIMWRMCLVLRAELYLSDNFLLSTWP